MVTPSGNTTVIPPTRRIQAGALHLPVSALFSTRWALHSVILAIGIAGIFAKVVA